MRGFFMPKNKSHVFTFTNMGLGINNQQAKAVKEGFLDTLGLDRNGFEPRQTINELQLIAGDLVDEAQKNLIKNNSIASGNLSESIIAGEPEASGGTVSIDVAMNFYGRFVDKGVKGTRGGKSNAGYFFKYELPSKKMVAALKEWMDRGKISVRESKQFKVHGRHDAKSRKLAKLSEVNAAYVISRSIKMKGLKPTGFMEKAIDTTTRTVADRLGQALKIDIIDGLTF